MKLFIGNNTKKEVELSESTTIALTYQLTDTENPSAVKNSFSKTIILQGTPINNKIFDEYWQINHSLSNKFNPKKKVDFILEENADIIERGYLQLNSITIENGLPQYEITLFGSLGECFYNLQTDEEGKKRTLASLDFKDDDFDTITWNKDSIYDSWQELKDNGEVFITAAPTYQGFYEEFDSNKILVNTYGLDTDIITQKCFPLQITNDKGKNFYPKNNYAMMEVDREMSEYEARDLVSHYQKPCIKLSKVLGAIADKDNNGGYEIVFDDEIKASKYFTDSYIILDNLSADENNTNAIDTLTSCQLYRNPVINKNEPSDTIQINGTFDTSNFSVPMLYLNLNETVNIPVINTGLSQVIAFNTYWQKNSTYVTCNLFKVRFDIYENNLLVGSSDNYFHTTLIGNYDKSNHNLLADEGQFFNDLQDDLIQRFGTAHLTIANKMDNVSGRNYVFDKAMHIELPLPQGHSISIQGNIELVTLLYDTFAQQFITPQQASGIDYYTWRAMLSGINNGKTYREVYDIQSATLTIQRFGTDADDSYIILDDNTHEYINGLFDENGVINGIKTVYTKEEFFSNTLTPLDYLLAFTKQLNLKFLVDPPLNKIFIKTLENYYLNEVVHPEIDYSKSIKIKPTLIDKKYYEYGLPVGDDNYAQYLYAKKNCCDIYGHFKKDTCYEFNSDTINILDSVNTHAGIDYQMKSQYFNNNRIYPNIALPSTYKWKLYNAAGNDDNEYEIEILGDLSRKTWSKELDYTGIKLCCFDKDYKKVDDCKDIFVFFNGFKDFNLRDRLLLTDNMKEMFTLNDGNNCYLYSNTEYNANNQRIAYFLTSLPTFNTFKRKGYTIDMTWDFFISKNRFYVGISYNSTMEIIENKGYIEKTLYGNFFDKYIDDIYDENGKSVTCYAILKDKPLTALRKFYFFENSFWVINKIVDYNPQNPQSPMQVEFIKVKSRNNYLGDNILPVNRKE